MNKHDWCHPRQELNEDPSYRELSDIMSIMIEGDPGWLDFTAAVVASFPHGNDPHFQIHWIIHAIANDCLNTLNWMLEQNVDLHISDHSGLPPLIAAVETSGENKYQIMSQLIAAGASLDARGLNGWSALHLAAIRDDEQAMQLLLLSGASRAQTTGVDDDLTAEQESRSLGHIKSAEFIAAFKQ